MRRGAAWLIAAIAPLGSAPATSAEAGDPLHLSVACGGVKECRYSGGDLRFRIRLKNAGTSALEIPIAYLRQAGPIVRLADVRGSGDTYLRRNLADEDLRKRFVALAPGRAATIDWLITEAELAAYRGPARLSAEVTIVATLRRNGAPFDYRGTDTLRIRRE